MAAGYLLKLSFDRGWISPVMRCIGGVVAGLGVGALGWRLEPRYRTYGAALVGAGAGIIYLCIWAACRLYGVLPSATGIVGLALVSVALAMIAYAINVEALGVTAALGAFFAPVLLGRERPTPTCCSCISPAWPRGLGWSRPGVGGASPCFVVAASYFGVGAAARPTTRIPGACCCTGWPAGPRGSTSACASAGGRPACSPSPAAGRCSPPRASG